MNMYELVDALDGLYAYDSGSIDSGVHDPVLKDECKKILSSMDHAGLVEFSRAVRDEWLSDTSLDQGYTLEDVKHFIDWLGLEMGYDL